MEVVEEQEIIKVVVVVLNLGLKVSKMEKKTITDLAILVLVVSLSIYTTFMFYGMQKRVADTWRGCDMWYEQNCDCDCGWGINPGEFPEYAYNLSNIRKRAESLRDIS